MKSVKISLIVAIQNIRKWRTNFVRRGAGSEAGRRKQEFCDRSPEKKYRLY